MIEVLNLIKSFGEVKAVQGVSFQVEAGEIFGLLGPNGAGKTTTFSMLTGLLEPDGGRVRFDGVDLMAKPREVKARLGVVPQEAALYDDLSAREHLRLWGGLYGLQGGELELAVHRALEEVDLNERADEAVKRFSGGMKRRLNLALGLVHRPAVVVLDEPTVGIDPQARRKILDVVHQVAKEGTAVLYTTHHLEEAEELCDRIAIIDHGTILAEGTLDELQRMVGGEAVVTLRGEACKELAPGFEDEAGVRILAREDERLVLATAETDDGRGSVALLERLFAEGTAFDGVTIEPPSLNGLFLKLTGRELRDS